MHVLSPWMYLRRNPGRSVPVLFVIVLSVVLVASIVTLARSIDLTVLTMYGYQRSFAVITPRNALEVPDDLERRIEAEPLTGRVVPMIPAFTTMKTVFGRMPVVVFGLAPEARSAILNKCGLRLSAGRMPEEGRPELIASEEIARSRGIRIGQAVLGPDIEDSFSPVPMRLVGTLKGPVWLALTSREYVAANYPLAPRSLLVIARQPADQPALDHRLDKLVDKHRARPWVYAQTVRETHDALSSLYVILAIVVGIVVFAIAFLTGMLANIFFVQRLPEFATLSAIGYRRAHLIRRAFWEIVLLCVGGWILGMAATVGLLYTLRALVMAPRAMLLNPLDLSAYIYTMPLPFTIVAFSLTTIWLRLHRFDPVTIIERRQ